MRSTILLSAALGAGALAFPHQQHQHKRQVIEDDVIVVSTITVNPGQAPAPTAEAKFAQPAGNGNGDIAWPSAWTITEGTGTTPASTSLPVQNKNPAPVQTPSTSPSTKPSPTPSSTPAASSTPSAASPSSASGGSTASDGSWATAPQSPPNVSGSKNILDSANTLRNAWKPGTSKFTWNSTLADNAYKTETIDEKGGSQMVHHLYPGSSSQCIIDGENSALNGTITPFESAFLGWICEDPMGYDLCAKVDGTTTKADETGHADIIGGDVSQIGCYYMLSKTYDPNSHLPKGMWTCDFQK